MPHHIKKGRTKQKPSRRFWRSMRNRFDSSAAAANNVVVSHNQRQQSPTTDLGEDRRQAVLRVLLTVEHEAQQIVNSAKAARVAKLQQAKQESEIELAGLREQMELDFEKTVVQIDEDSGSYAKRLEQDAETKINQLKLKGEKLRDDIATMLMQHVMAVRV